MREKFFGPEKINKTVKESYREIKSFLRSLAKDHDLMFFLSDFRSLSFSVRISPAVIKVVVTIFIFLGGVPVGTKKKKRPQDCRRRC